MAYIKCPRCELNYIIDGDKLCTICSKEVKGEPDNDNMVELCLECGERSAVHGEELCLFCLKEHGVRKVTQPKNLFESDSSLDLDSVSLLEEIEIDADEDLPADLDDETIVEFEDVDVVEDADDVGDAALINADEDEVAV